METRDLQLAERLTTPRPSVGLGAFPAVLRTGLLALALFLLALAPRALSPGDFLTTDEQTWFRFSEEFLAALQTGQYADIRPRGHPGVTTLWLGATGRLAYESLVAQSWVDLTNDALQRRLFHLPVAVVTALSVALAYPLLRRLLGMRVALLATLFWAADPFLVAHAKVLHLDALLASFMTLSLLAALVAVQFPAFSARFTLYMSGSAVAGGLAALTKSPALALLPMIGLITLLGLARPASHEPGYVTRGARHGWRLLCACCLVGAVWTVLAALVWIALWPAAWVDLSGTVMKVIGEATDNGGTAHELGNFFLGRPVDDPGLLFYPIAIALRLTPWALLGLVAFGFSTLWNRKPGSERASHATRSSHTTLLVLCVYVLLFVAMLTMSPKKFDRYALSVFPALNIIAAAGWIGLIRILDFRPFSPPSLPLHCVRGHGSRAWFEGKFWILDRNHPQSTIHNLKLIWLLIVLLLALNLAWYHPYQLAYYNPLLGGGATAMRTILVGWGEGLEQVGAFIAAQPDGCDRPVASQAQTVLRVYVCTPVVDMSAITTPDQVRYAVLYISHLQRNREHEQANMLRALPPLHTVRIHGIDYAYVYQLPPPVAHPLEADFGSAIHLRGYDLDTAAVRATQSLTLTLQWQAHAPIERDYALFVHVLDSSGQRLGQVDVPPGGPRAATSAWQPRQYVTLTQRIPLSADLPAGTYWLALGIYDPYDLTRLPLHGPPQSGVPDNGPDTLLVGPIAIP